MEYLKKAWSSLTLLEKISLFVGAVGTAIILALLLSARGAIDTVLPYLFLVGAVESLASAVFLWRKDKKRALLMGIFGPVIFILFFVLLVTGQL